LLAFLQHRPTLASHSAAQGGDGGGSSHDGRAQDGRGIKKNDRAILQENLCPFNVKAIFF
jgi:hypothetical protein